VILHPKTEPLRELVAQLDQAPMFAKFAFARELIDRLLTIAAEQAHALDKLAAEHRELAAALAFVQKLEARVAALEQFPETRT
jgi:hypothetical protein